MAGSVVSTGETVVLVVSPAPQTNVITTELQRTVVTKLAGEQGPQGPPGAEGATGPTGPQGPQGDPGTDLTYVHNQASPLAVWLVTHGLGKYPSVTIVDSGNTQVHGQVEYVDTNQVRLTFSGAFSGIAYFN